MPSRDLIRVVAAVVERDGRRLLGRRPEEKRHGGLWEFPGGKVQAGESITDAVTRELAEELSLQVTTVGVTRLTVRDGDSPFVIDFVDASATGVAAAHEHSEIGWFTLTKMNGVALAPADAAFVAALVDSAT